MKDTDLKLPLPDPAALSEIDSNNNKKRKREEDSTPSNRDELLKQAHKYQKLLNNRREITNFRWFFKYSSNKGQDSDNLEQEPSPIARSLSLS